MMFQRTKTQKEKLFTYSKPVDSISQFWSHSWHGKHYWKAWSLLLLVLSKLVVPIMGKFLAFSHLVDFDVAILKGINFVPVFFSEHVSRLHGIFF